MTKKREIIEEVHSQILNMRQEIKELRSQMNDVIDWQIRMQAPTSTPIPIRDKNSFDVAGHNGPHPSAQFQAKCIKCGSNPYFSNCDLDACPCRGPRGA